MSSLVNLIVSYFYTIHCFFNIQVLKVIFGTRKKFFYDCHKNTETDKQGGHCNHIECHLFQAYLIVKTKFH